MTEVQLLNWQALYLATAIICVVAASLAAATLTYQIAQEQPWRKPITWQAALLALPRLWWRWQRLYWLATPVILAIVTAFGLSLDWS